MPRRHNDLFDQVSAFPALIKAARVAIKGKRKKPGASRFMANLEKECLALERALRNQSWRPSGFVSFRIQDPKPRLISAAPKGAGTRFGLEATGAGFSAVRLRCGLAQSACHVKR